MIQYFQTLLTEPQQDKSEAINKTTCNIPKFVSPKHNYALLRPTTLEEIKREIMDIPKGKSLRPNGITTDFFQACWPIIK